MKDRDTKVTMKFNDGKEIETTVGAMQDISDVGIIASGIIAEMSAAVKDLSFQNWPHISRIIDTSEPSKINISFSCEVDRSSKQPKVTTSIGFAEKYKDKRESYIKDPRQEEMAFEKKGDE